MADAITSEQLNALGEHPEAVAALCEVASAYVAEHWNEAMGRDTDSAGNPNYGLTYWEEAFQYPRGEDGPTWDAVWFDWLLLDDSTVPGGRGGVPCFIGGMTGSEGTDLLPGEAGKAWAEPLIEQHGFIRFTEGEHERFARVAYPEDVVKGDTLEEQGESLGAWAVAGLRALGSNWPPAFVETPGEAAVASE
jgi:hypothetical protein